MGRVFSNMTILTYHFNLSKWFRPILLSKLKGTILNKSQTELHNSSLLTILVKNIVTKCLLLQFLELNQRTIGPVSLP